jgi:integrase
MSESTLYRRFKEICVRVGLEGDFTPHCARATAITQLLNQGFSHRDIKEFSRHSSIQMVEQYDKRRTSIDDSIAKKLSFSTK